jgi:hypothetical protein
VSKDSKEPKPYPEPKGLVSRQPAKPPPQRGGDGSNEGQAIESNQGPRCPECKEVAYKGGLGGDGLGTCNYCQKQFRFKIEGTAKKAVFKTWKTTQRKEEPSKTPEVAPFNPSGIIGPSSSK